MKGRNFPSSYSLFATRPLRNPMTHPSIHARSKPDKIAYQMAGSGTAITYRELDEISNQGAHLFRVLDLKSGNHYAFLMGNRPAFMDTYRADHPSGRNY